MYVFMTWRVYLYLQALWGHFPSAVVATFVGYSDFIDFLNTSQRPSQNYVDGK